MSSSLFFRLGLVFKIKFRLIKPVLNQISSFFHVGVSGSHNKIYLLSRFVIKQDLYLFLCGMADLQICLLWATLMTALE